VDYPARYDSVIAVAATDSNDNRASWSSTGSAVELAAPGVSIKSTYLGGRYAIKSGTSMACPHVAGTAALVIASGEGDVRPCLQQTADDLGAPGKDNLYGYGLVDADEAAHSTGNQAPVADAGADQTALVDETVSFDGSGSYDPDGTIVSYEWDFDYDSTTFTVDASGVDLTNPSHIYDSEGPYTVALRVEDDDGDISSISTATLKVTAPDEQAPVIIDATGDIDGTTGEPVTVSATITDNVGVVSATVHYTPIDGTETTASMIEGASDVWSADVPVDSDKVGTITYYISAQDATPNTARDPTTGTYSITVADKDDPGPIPDLSATAVAGGNVELAWSSVTTMLLPQSMQSAMRLMLPTVRVRHRMQQHQQYQE
jgi:PKD repeat protein